MGRRIYRRLARRTVIIVDNLEAIISNQCRRWPKKELKLILESMLGPVLELADCAVGILNDDEVVAGGGGKAG
jgi:hypothetical protein